MIIKWNTVIQGIWYMDCCWDANMQHLQCEIIVLSVCQGKTKIHNILFLPKCTCTYMYPIFYPCYRKPNNFFCLTMMLNLSKIHQGILEISWPWEISDGRTTRKHNAPPGWIHKIVSGIFTQGSLQGHLVILMKIAIFLILQCNGKGHY